MAKEMKTMLVVLVVMLAAGACKKDKDDNTNANPNPKLIVKLVTNANQERLGNTGAPATIPQGHAAQIPVFNLIAAHYLEFAPNAQTQLGNGVVLYRAPETTAGGVNAIDFSKSVVVVPGTTFLEIPLKDIAKGSYEWVRLSLSYQNYDVQFYYGGQPFTGTLASFVGFNTYIGNYTIKGQTVGVHGNKLQGYWGFETVNNVFTGQAPAGATTVPNPLFASSPIPQGSCVVTGKFADKLAITGKETHDIIVKMSLSVNNSFEWNDENGNGKWDVDNGNENVVDMGLRGLIPLVE